MTLLSVCLIVCLSACLSICLSIYRSMFLCIYLSLCLSFHISVYLFLLVYVYESVCLSICRSVCLCGENRHPRNDGINAGHAGEYHGVAFARTTARRTQSTVGCSAGKSALRGISIHIIYTIPILLRSSVALTTVRSSHTKCWVGCGVCTAWNLNCAPFYVGRPTQPIPDGNLVGSRRLILKSEFSADCGEGSAMCSLLRLLHIQI